MADLVDSSRIRFAPHDTVQVHFTVTRVSEWIHLLHLNGNVHGAVGF
jgi:hypothetical protein